MFVYLLLTFSLCQIALGDQHILLDTTKESMLDWTRYPYGPQSPTPGWVEESFTNFEKGINWRSYVVCDVGYPNVNNWLWTPFITRHDANRIYIEIKFSLRNCDLFPGTALQCKETFSLLYYEFDAATREPPPWEPESYKQIDVIAADEGRFTSNNEVIINTETRSIDVTKKGVYFAFRDQGACLSLLAVKVYYLKCPEITIGFAHYPETATGALPSSIEKVKGKCVNNAVAVMQPYNLCTSDGSWSYHSGLCSCMAGYEADEAGMACKPCPVGHFKEKAGQEKCQICPPHSQALYVGSVECRCTSGYFRSLEDSKQASCTRPPTAPQRLRFTLLEGSKIRLAWDPPRDEGARTDTKYSVVCASNCNDKKLRFSPSSRVLSGTSVTVSGLEAGSAYVFQVRALNGVSELSISNDNSSVSEISVVADFKGAGSSASGGAVTNLHVTDIKPTQITLKWAAPSDPSFQDTAEVYEVRYTVRHSNTSNVVITKRDTAEIKNLEENTEYVFQVRAQTQRGWGDFSAPIYENTGRTLEDGGAVYMGDGQDGEDSSQVAVVVISSLLVLVLLFVLAMFLCRRRSAALKRTLKEQEALKYQGVENTFVTETYPIVQTQLAGSSGIYNPFSNHKTYIDPHTYEDPNIAVKQFAKEIDAKFITIEAIIGGGEFGDVCRGRLSVPDRNDMLVAIKTLKPGSADKAKVDFLTEASIMGQFEHPNVIFLQGVVTKANPIMIITEYMENGSLDTFLRANDGKFQIMQLVGMMRGIAYGMQYLSEMNYVHRDLAARNVLVNSQLVCKIADFGLSREITASDGANGGGDGAGAYTTRGGKIPVRWTAPEAIAFRKFTSASDVWSFGIVMWEVMSFGERPYWTWSNQDVIKAIEKGYRLPAPMDCPEAIHQLMLDTWQKERGHRPSFASIVKTLDKLICCPETLKKLAVSPTHMAYDGSGPDLSSFASVDEWLASIKMSRYSAAFRQAGLDDMGQVVKLNLSELVELGVTLVGHQKKIMSSIQAMRNQLSVNMSEGFLV